MSHVLMCCESLRIETSMTKLSTNRAEQRAITMLLCSAASSPWVFHFPVVKGDTLEGAPHKPVVFVSGSAPVLSAPGAKRHLRRARRCPQGCGGNRQRWAAPCMGTRHERTRVSDPTALIQGWQRVAGAPSWAACFVSKVLLELRVLTGLVFHSSF